MIFVTGLFNDWSLHQREREKDSGNINAMWLRYDCANKCLTCWWVHYLLYLNLWMGTIPFIYIKSGPQGPIWYRWYGSQGSEKNLFQDHGKIIGFHDKFLISLKNHWILVQLRQKSLNIAIDIALTKCNGKYVHFIYKLFTDMLFKSFRMTFTHRFF